MTVKLTVAIVGDLDALGSDESGAIVGLRYPEDWEIPYAERPKVEVAVPESASLGSVLRHVAQRSGAESPPWGSWEIYTPAFVAFYREDRDADFGRLHHEVALLDADGRVRWASNWADESVGEYLRASQAGVLDGDARRPYLVLQPPMGNGVLADFPTLVELWRLWWEIAEKVGIVGGLWAIWKAASPRLRSGESPGPPDSADVVDGLYVAWRENGGRPDNLVELLGQRPWHLQDLAELLGCSPGQAEALLMGFGHERTSSGLWMPGDSQHARLLRGNAEFVIHAGMTTQLAAVESIMRIRAEHFAGTGEAPDLDWTGLGDLPYDDQRLAVDGVTVSPASMRERLEVVLRYRAASVLHRVRRSRGRR